MNTIIHEREIFKRIASSIDSDAITVIIGARQVGKTSAMRYFKERCESDGGSAFYFDLEHLDLREAFNNTKNAVKYLAEQGITSLNKQTTLFIDEIQYLDDPSNLLKIIHDHHPEIKCVVSGSSTLKIREKFKDSMAGRKNIITMYPLTFREFAFFSSRNDLLNTLNSFNLNAIIKEKRFPKITPLTSQNLIELFEEFVIFGGYPKTATSKTKEARLNILQDTFDSYILKDIKDFAHIHDVRKFNNVIKFLAVQNGGLLNSLEVSKELGIARDTLNKHIFLLENTFCLSLIPSFFTNRQKEITRMQKTYFVDTGMRNLIVKDFRELSLRDDRGLLVENAIANELVRSKEMLDELCFWRTPQKNEVDFILRREAGEIIPIEVKYSNFDSPEIPSGLLAFIGRYSPKTAVIVTKNFFSALKRDKTDIVFVPAWAI